MANIKLSKRIADLKDQLDFYENFEKEFQDYVFCSLAVSDKVKFINAVFEKDQVGLLEKINKITFSDNGEIKFHITDKYYNLILKEKIKIYETDSINDNFFDDLIYDYIYQVHDFVGELKILNLERFVPQILKFISNKLSNQGSSCEIPEQIKKLLVSLL